MAAFPALLGSGYIRSLGLHYFADINVNSVHRVVIPPSDKSLRSFQRLLERGKMRFLEIFEIRNYGCHQISLSMQFFFILFHSTEKILTQETNCKW